LIFKKNFAFVSTAILKCIQIFYSKDKIERQNKDVVLVHIEDWPKRADSPLESNKSFGKPGEHDTEIHAILAEYGYHLNYRSGDCCTKN
jgi:ribonuclease R